MGFTSFVARVLPFSRSIASPPPRPLDPPFMEVEALEKRCLLTATITQTIAPVTVGAGTTTINAAQYFSDPTITGTFVDFKTSVGSIEVQLFDQQTPQTVANFLKYVNAGLYNNTIVHRSPPGFVVQGGGYTASGTHIQQFAPVANEPGISNTAGTIAMAKIDGQPNSATSEWFFNVGDNAQTLDNQNGGFTVFGRVVSGLNVVDSINQLPTVSTTLGPTSFANLPVVNLPTGQQPTAANLVDVTSVAVASTPQLIVQARSSDNTIVNPSISGENVILNTSGKSGYAAITVTASGLDGKQVEQTFRVHVVGNATQTRQVVLGAGGSRSVSYRDSNNIPASITYTGPGTATLNFIANSFTAATEPRGTNLQLDSITISGSTAASNLTVSGPASSKKTTYIGPVTVSGSANTIRFAHATLAAGLSVTGAVKNLQLDGASNGNITISGGTRLNLIGTAFNNEGVTSAAPIGQIKVTNWVNEDATQPITAPSVSSVRVRQNFTPGLVLNGAASGKSRLLGSIVVGGLIGGAWTIAGALPNLRIGGTSNDFNGTFTTAIPYLKVGFLSGSLTVPSIRRLRVTGSINGALLTLNAPLASGQYDLKQLEVLGPMQQSTILSSGNIGDISTRGISASDIYAGVGSVAQGTSLPGVAADFNAQASIGSVTAKPVRSTLSFQNSNIAAWSLGALDLGATSTTNNGTPFGVAAHTIGSFNVTDRTRGQSFHFSKLTSASQLSALISARKLTLADLKITLV